MVLKAEESIIQLNDVKLPGIFQELSINGEYVMDTAKSAGDNTSHKSINGSKDKSISLTLQLLPTLTLPIYQQIEILEKLFYEQANNNPNPIQIFNEHINARGIDSVLFTGFSSSENNSTNIVMVTLQFEEYTN